MTPVGPFQDTIFGGILGGTLVGAVLLFIQFLINRSDKKKEKNDKIIAKLEEFSNQLTAFGSRMNKENADDARRRILSFDDELRRNVGHSEESYNQILDDIREYEHYCKAHDDYKNSKAVAATANIKETYVTVKKSNDFI